MPRNAKRLASSERTLALPEAVGHIRFNRKGGRVKSRGYMNQDGRLRQQTLTQIDFVSRISMGRDDLNLIEDEEPLGVHLENPAKVEQANAVTYPSIGPSTVATTPPKKRKLEIPSSHSPPDSPYRPGSRGNPRESVSPLATRAEQLPTKSASRSGTTLGTELSPTRMVENVLVASPLENRDISRGVGTGVPLASRHSTVEITAFEEETEGIIMSRLGRDGDAPLVGTLKMPACGLTRTEIRDSDDDGSEIGCDIVSETQAAVDLAHPPEFCSDDEISSPGPAYEVTSRVTGHAGAGVTNSANGGISKAKQVSFEESTTVKLDKTGSGTSQLCGHVDSGGCGIEDACIQPGASAPGRSNESNHSQRSASAFGNHCTAPGEISRDNDVQSTSTLPLTHTKSPSSRSTILDLWMENYARSGPAGEGIYEFESPSQLLPESLMNESLPLPPGFSQEFLDEDNY